MKILIIHDFISTDIFHDKHLVFIEKLLHYLDVEITLGTNENFHFSRTKMISFLNKKHRDSKLITQIKFTDHNLQSLSYIESILSKYDLLITFELSNESKQLFDSLKISYLDIWVSPIRFCKDVMFECYSNNNNIQQKLSKFKIKKKTIESCTQSLINHYNFFMPQIKLQLKKNSALLIAQLSMDKAIMKNDKFLTLLDYKDEISSLAKQYTKIYLLKHPLMSKTEFVYILDGLKEIKNLEYIENINTYQILADKSIQAVISISSSVLTEAEYFNKKSIYLYKPVLNKKYKRISNAIYSSEFWKNIFDIKSNKKNIDLLIHDNYMRYCFNLYYSYKPFMNDFYEERIFNDSYKIIVKLFEKCKNLDKNKKYILYGFGSVGQLILPHIPNLIGIIDKAYLRVKPSFHIIQLEELHLYPDASIIISPFIHQKEILKTLAKLNNPILTLLEELT